MNKRHYELGTCNCCKRKDVQIAESFNYDEFIKIENGQIIVNGDFNICIDCLAICKNCNKLIILASIPYSTAEIIRNHLPICNCEKRESIQYREIYPPYTTEEIEEQKEKEEIESQNLKNEYINDLKEKKRKNEIYEQQLNISKNLVNTGIFYFYNNFQIPNEINLVKSYLNLKGIHKPMADFIFSPIDNYNEDDMMLINRFFGFGEEITEQNISDFICIFKNFIETKTINYSDEINYLINEISKNTNRQEDMLRQRISDYMNDFKSIIRNNLKDNLFYLSKKKWFHQKEIDNNYKSKSIINFLKFFSLDKDKDFKFIINYLQNYNKILNFLGFLIILTIFVTIFIMMPY